MLLKQRVLHALTRLGDRDTIRVAVKELTRLIATMPPEHIPVVIGCLCDEAAAAPKAVARRVRPRPRPSRPSERPTVSNQRIRLSASALPPDLAHLFSRVHHLPRRRRSFVCWIPSP